MLSHLYRKKKQRKQHRMKNRNNRILPQTNLQELDTLGKPLNSIE